MSRTRILIIVLFAAAALLRFVDVFRPINHASWRESDLGSISRNFVREGMDPLYPRVDWRGDGPGYSEMELPVMPWLTAATYEVFGVHDQIGRVWSFLFTLGALFFFFRLAREHLGTFASIAAFAFFALNPLMVGIGSSIQPEGLTIFAYIAAAYYFFRWLKTETSTDFWLAAAFTSLTVLAKAPSAHIGLLFGILLIRKYGWRVVSEARVWIFGGVSLVPGALWYIHARNLWLTFGNSLGVSNEYHWIGRDFFTDPHFITGILRIEIDYVWTIFGLILLAFAVWRGYRDETLKLSLLWLLSVFAFYIIAARTASEDWAVYYHAFSVPAAALIIGFSTQALFGYAREFTDRFSTRKLAANLGRVFVISFVFAALLASLGLEGKRVRANMIDNRIDSPGLAFAAKIKPLVKPDDLILVSGGHCLDPKGYQVAYNASYMFYWLDRKGWNICVEDESVTGIREYARKGAKYFIAEKKFVNQRPGLLGELDHTFTKLDDSDDFAIYQLTEGK